MSGNSLAARLKEAVEAAKGPQTELEYQEAEVAETESLTTELVVHFAEGSAQASICLTHLLKQLERDTVITDLELNGPPDNYVILLGSIKGEHFKVVFSL